ncbi:arsenate reductase/protein-tyrosine-phosphatase family protein [Cellulomonas sp. URHB0016]
MNPDPFRVLVVCTGNVCRSPAVERLLAAGLGAAYRGKRPRGSLAPAIEVASAGTAAMVGAPMTPEMAALVGSAGLDPDGFQARQLSSAMVQRADIVVALTRDHRSAVVELHPAAVRRAFTLRELARLSSLVEPAELPGAGATTADRLRALVPLVASRRGLVPTLPAHDDVPDPFGRGDAAYRRSFAQMAPAVEAVVAAVRR